MSEGVKTTEEKAAEARRGPARRGGPPHMAMGQPTEKSLDFAGSTKRLLKMMGRDRRGAIGLVLAGIISVTLTVLGPKVLGSATDIVVRGVVEPGGIRFDDLRLSESWARPGSPRGDEEVLPGLEGGFSGEICLVVVADVGA